tara:strand:- start:212 stop:535 length:324 start_codon:yes stop_codon:yes gene_type:complete
MKNKNKELSVAKAKYEGGVDEGYRIPHARCSADVIKQAVEIERHYRHKNEIGYIDEDVVVLNDEMDKMKDEGILTQSKSTRSRMRYIIRSRYDEEEVNNTPNEWRKK